MENPGFGDRYGGVLGIYVCESGQTADLELGLDNARNENLTKYVFVSVDIYTQLDPSQWNSLIDRVQYRHSDHLAWIDLDTSAWHWDPSEPGVNWRQLTIEFSIDPQPLWEEVRIDFDLPVGHSFILDNACMASYCTTGEPSRTEPTTWGAIKAMYE
jgi:hypothetical protein